MSRADRVYLCITVFLLIAAIAGGVMLGLQRRGNQPAEIVLSQTEPPQQNGELYISGAVASPGIYPWHADDTLKTVLLDAGIESEADLRCIEVYVPQAGERASAQKIDINRADPWLLERSAGPKNRRLPQRKRPVQNSRAPAQGQRHRFSDIGADKGLRDRVRLGSLLQILLLPLIPKKFPKYVANLLTPLNRPTTL